MRNEPENGSLVVRTLIVQNGSFAVLSDSPRHRIGRVAMVVADDYALSRIFSANHVARYRFRYDTSVCERKIFGDNAAPTVGSKLDPRHSSNYTRRTQAGNSRIGLANVVTRCLGVSRDYSKFFNFCFSSHFTSVPTSCARSRGQMSALQ